MRKAEDCLKVIYSIAQQSGNVLRTKDDSFESHVKFQLLISLKSNETLLESLFLLKLKIERTESNQIDFDFDLIRIDMFDDERSNDCVWVGLLYGNSICVL